MKPLRLFYWTCRVYESITLAFANDREEAHRLIVERVQKEYADVDVPNVDINDLSEIPMPDEPKAMLFATWD